MHEMCRIAQETNMDHIQWKSECTNSLTEGLSAKSTWSILENSCLSYSFSGKYCHLNNKVHEPDVEQYDMEKAEYFFETEELPFSTKAFIFDFSACTYSSQEASSLCCSI
jgi:hypothetical protein